MPPTNYNVTVTYNVSGNAQVGLNQIAANAERAARSSDGLRTSLLAVGGAFLGSRVFGAARDALIGFNDQMANAKIKIAGMLQMNIGGVWEANMARATKSVERFQEMARKSPLTTEGIVGVASGIEASMLRAGLNQTQIEKLAFGAAGAGMAFGGGGARGEGLVTGDINQAMRGSMTMRNAQILGPMLGPDGIKKLNESARKSPQEAANTLLKLFDSGPLKKMMEEQAHTFTGEMSTLKDTIQIALGKVGLPLFKKITAEVRRWNEWMEANSAKLEKFGEKMGDALVTGFGVMKDAVEFMVDHADTLMALAKLWAANKIGGMAGGMLGAAGGWLAGAAGALFSPVGMVGKAGSAGAAGRMGMSSWAGPAAMAGLFGWEIGKSLRGNKLMAPIEDAASIFGSMLYGEKSKAEKAFDLNRAAMARMRAAADKVAQQYAGAKTSTGMNSSRGTALYATLAGSGVESAQQKVDEARRKFFMDNMMNGVGGQTFSSLISGLNQNGVNSLGAGGDYARALANQTRVNRNVNVAPGVADAGVEAAMTALSASEREVIDQNEALAEALRLTVTTMDKTGGLTPTLDEFIKLLKDMADKETKGFKKGGDTNIKIAKVEVAAKDPDRWIMDLDRAVAKRVRAPRAARSKIRH